MQGSPSLESEWMVEARRWGMGGLGYGTNIRGVEF